MKPNPQAVEDGFHECRSTEDQQLSKEALPRTCFRKLHDSSVLHERHHYEKLDTSGVPVKRNVRLPDDFFYNKNKATDERKKHEVAEGIDLRAIVGYGNPTWYGPQITNMFQQHADLDMLDYLNDVGQQHMKDHLWLNELVSTPGKVLLRRKPPHASGWYLAVATNSGSATYVWPVEKLPLATDSDTLFFRVTRLQPGEPRRLEFIAIVDLNDWEAYHIEAVSPLHTHMKFPKTFMGKLTRILFLARGDPQPLLLLAATRCFWNLNVVFLRRLAAHVAIAVDPGCDLFDVCRALVSGIAKPNSDGLRDILRLRLLAMSASSAGAYNALLECDEAMEYATRDEKEVLNKEKDIAEASQSERARFLRSYTHEWKQSNALSVKSGALSVSAKRKILKDAMVGRLKEVPAVATLTDEVAKQLAPPNSMICIEERDICWRGSWGGYPRVSRAWSLYGGSKGALIQLLRALWKLFLDEHTIATSECPVAGIF